MKYRKKPVIIEAVQLNIANWEAVCNLTKHSERKIKGSIISYEMQVEIETLEGVMLAREGDYIIKGIKGEIYPCKPDIFKATYEKVEENEKRG